MVFYFIQYSLYNEFQQKELTLQNKSSELSLLRSQINPHFLFNNLNNIYSLVYHNSKQSLNAISGLSELLRFMLYEKSEFIPLENEINYIKKYIELEQLRFERPSLIKFCVEKTKNEPLIPPLLLIPFIENAFKHGKVSFEEHWLEIDIKVEHNGDIVVRCINNVGIKAKAPIGGIGLENVKKRLEILYQGDYKFEIHHIENKFVVNLEINNKF
ncbi:sensor histidine kinase [Arachidicoccus terrestris]|uniref:sensor histidine kinase n=1 Tax=Arachidicoccus terrestris TaxID=2875539 RepID=UPI001CC4F28A|nr:sensor histidine kinase [Arachidicoccus terrestris]